MHSPMHASGEESEDGEGCRGDGEGATVEEAGEAEALIRCCCGC